MSALFWLSEQFPHRGDAQLSPQRAVIFKELFFLADY